LTRAAQPAPPRPGARRHLGSGRSPRRRCAGGSPGSTAEVGLFDQTFVHTAFGAWVKVSSSSSASSR
ncbi:hypothetical protein HMPREF0298_0672, partial [Corynebacterium lipophiloflavum DSM 44291]